MTHIKYNRGINHINKEIELYIYNNRCGGKESVYDDRCLVQYLLTAFKSYITNRRDGICSITSYMNTEGFYDERK